MLLDDTFGSDWIEMLQTCNRNIIIDVKRSQHLNENNVLKSVLYILIKNDTIKAYVIKDMTVNRIRTSGDTFNVLSNSVYNVVIKNTKVLDCLTE